MLRSVVSRLLFSFPTFSASITVPLSSRLARDGRSCTTGARLPLGARRTLAGAGPHQLSATGPPPARLTSMSWPRSTSRRRPRRAPDAAPGSVTGTWSRSWRASPTSRATSCAPSAGTAPTPWCSDAGDSGGGGVRAALAHSAPPGRLIARRLTRAALTSSKTATGRRFAMPVSRVALAPRLQHLG